MILHKNQKALLMLIRLTAAKYDINPQFIEKDYWITLILQRLSMSGYSDIAIFKGGTSLSKGYGIISRFSEDVDIALCQTKEASGNKIKATIRAIEKAITGELKEVEIDGITSKGSRFRKSIYAYDSLLGKTVQSKSNVIVEVNSFANPYPFAPLKIESFIARYLKETNNLEEIETYGLQEFSLNILDKRQTLIEKLVSLVRFSHLGKNGLASKIRHFYDIHFLLQDTECREYIKNGNFKADFQNVLAHDKEMFEDPKGWQYSKLEDLPLFNDTERVWNEIAPIYQSDLSGLAFTPIPAERDVLNSFIEITTTILDHI